MSTVRRTISLPKAVADRLDAGCKRRGIPFSKLVVELAEGRRSRPKSLGSISDDPEVSLKVEEILARAFARRR